MARPRTEDGFVMIALDLFAAIESCGISNYARIALAEIVLRSYGPNKDDVICIDGPTLSAITGLERGNAYRAIRELTSGNLIIAAEHGFRLNKDYESWKSRRDPLAGGSLSRWISGTSTRVGLKRRHRSHSESAVSIQTQPTPSAVSIQTQKNLAHLDERGSEYKEREEELREEEKPPLSPLDQKPDDKPKAKPLVLPEWLPLKDWEEFVEMRRETDRPMTLLAKRKQLFALGKLRSKGNDPAMVLQQSIEHAWESLYDVKPDFRQSSKPTPQSHPERPKPHVAPADSPYRKAAEEDRRKLFALFGGTPPDRGSSPAVEPRSGEVGPGLQSAG